VNVSARQFLQETFASRVAAVLTKNGLSPSLLEVELTESTVMTQPDRVIDQLLQLRAIGVDVAIDDFGTGYSSLSYLKRLPLKTIKIDRSFVHDVDTDADNRAIVSAILGLAKTLGMSVVAEGVETEGEEEHLKETGCAVAQGYRYTRPLPARDFAAWLSRRETVAQQ
jgi:EAL domain-containing protein (putative c-di-GMP-specific phosphodiesterase class I)